MQRKEAIQIPITASQSNYPQRFGQRRMDKLSNFSDRAVRSSHAFPTCDDTRFKRLYHFNHFQLGRATSTTEHELREKLRKIAALFEGATREGEREAAAAALARVREKLSAAEMAERRVEFSFRLPDRWNRRLFLALCRRYGVRPYRYPRQRYSTVVVRVPESFVNWTLWPEFLEISRALDEYPNEATERIIRDEVFGDAGEAEERPEAPAQEGPAFGFSLESEG